MILRPAAKPPSKPDPVGRLLATLRLCQQPLLCLLHDPPPAGLSDPASSLFPSLYHLLPLAAILDVLADTGTLSQRQRKLPAHQVVWLVIAQSWFADRSLPMVWRHIGPSPKPSDGPAPVDSSFTEARQRLGARPLQLLFHRTCRPMATPQTPQAYHQGFLLVALDGSVLEAPDTPANRSVLGSARNQYGEGAFPQLRLAAICEVATHAITDVEMGPYNSSELDLSLRLLRRLPPCRLVLMDRGLSYYKQISTVRRRHSHVLARVKAAQRDLPVEKVLRDGSYLSTVYPSSNAKRGKRGGIVVRVIRYTHDDPSRDGCGEEACLITTVLSVGVLSAAEALRLYPFRWEEESVFLEIKETLLRGKQPLLRSKEPTLVVQEVYGLLIGHYLLRRVMVQAAKPVGAEPMRLSFKHSLEVLEDRLKDPAGPDWLAHLHWEVSLQKLRPKRPRKYARHKKATRSRWPNKKPGSKPPPQPTKHFSQVARILHSDGH